MEIRAGDVADSLWDFCLGSCTAGEPSLEIWICLWTGMT